MLHGDDLTIQLFILTAAIAALGLAVTQGGITHRLFVLAMVLLGCGLVIVSMLWGAIGPRAPQLDDLLLSISAHQSSWLLLGITIGAAAASRSEWWPWGHRIILCLERDSVSERYGIQTFPSVTYIQIAATTRRQLRRCRAWVNKIEYRASAAEPFSLENNERHPCRWSRPSGNDVFEIDIIPGEPAIRLNVALYNERGLQYEPEVGTPTNLIDLFQRIGLHRLEMRFTWTRGTKIRSVTRYLFIFWRGPDEGATVTLE